MGEKIKKKKRKGMKRTEEWRGSDYSLEKKTIQYMTFQKDLT